MLKFSNYYLLLTINFTLNFLFEILNQRIFLFLLSFTVCELITIIKYVIENYFYNNCCLSLDVQIIIYLLIYNEF